MKSTELIKLMRSKKMKTKIKSVTVIGINFFKNYEVGQIVNGLKIDKIEGFGSDADGESFAGFSIIDGEKSIIFDLIRVPTIVHYEEDKPKQIKYCIECENELDEDGYCKTEGCSKYIPF